MQRSHGHFCPLKSPSKNTPPVPIVSIKTAGHLEEGTTQIAGSLKGILARNFMKENIV
jgi:hypothetical protein